MSEEVTPTAVFGAFLRWWWLGLFSLALIVGLIIGAWQLGWIFTNANTTRTNQLIQNGTSYQESLRSQITAKIGDVQQYTVQLASPAYKPEWPAIKQARFYAATLACGDAAQITGVPLRPAQDSWVRANCASGNVAATSPYYVTGTPGQ